MRGDPRIHGMIKMNSGTGTDAGNGGTAVPSEDRYVPVPVGSAADPAGIFDNVYRRMLVITDTPPGTRVENVPWDPTYMLGVLKAGSLMTFPAEVAGRMFTVVGGEMKDVTGRLPTLFGPDGGAILVGTVMLAGPCVPGGIPDGLTDTDLVFLRPHVQMLRAVLPDPAGDGALRPVTLWGLTGCVSRRKVSKDGKVPPLTPVTAL